MCRAAEPALWGQPPSSGASSASSTSRCTPWRTSPPRTEAIRREPSGGRTPRATSSSRCSTGTPPTRCTAPGGSSGSSPYSGWRWASSVSGRAGDRPRARRSAGDSASRWSGTGSWWSGSSRSTGRPYLDFGFNAFTGPGTLVALVGSTILGIALLRRRSPLGPARSLLALAIPLTFAMVALFGHLSAGLVPLELAWILVGLRLLREPPAQAVAA